MNMSISMSTPDKLTEQITQIITQCQQKQKDAHTILKQFAILFAQVITNFNSQISNTQTRSKNIAMEVKCIKENIQKNNDILYQRVQKLRSQSTGVTHNIAALQGLLNQYQQNVYSHIDQGNRKLRQEFNNILVNSNNSRMLIKDSQQQTRASMSDSSLSRSQQKSIQNISNQIKLINASKWVDPNCPHWNRITFQSNKIKYDNGSNWIYVFGRQSYHDRSFSFTIKVINLHLKMSICIVDIKKKGQQIASTDPNAVYYCNNGYFWNGYESYTHGNYNKGDIITMNVQKDTGIVRLLKNNVKLLEIYCHNIKISKQLVPYICLHSRLDTVAIIKS